MRLRSQLVIGAAFGALVSPLVFGWSLVAILFGMVVGVISVVGQYAIWADAYNQDHGSRFGGAHKRDIQAAKSALRLGLAGYVFLIALVLIVWWILTGSGPGLKAPILLAPALMILLGYALLTWQESRPRR